MRLCTEFIWLRFGTNEYSFVPSVQNRSNFTDLLRGYELHRTKTEGVPVTINLPDISLKFHTLNLFVIFS